MLENNSERIAKEIFHLNGNIIEFWPSLKRWTPSFTEAVKVLKGYDNTTLPL